MKKYTKKQFIDMVGVKFSTLRFYERIKLLNPVKDAENNYREYTTFDAFLINRFRRLRALGFSTKEALDLTSVVDRKAFLEQIKEKKREVHRELLVIQSKLEGLEKTEKAIHLSEHKEIFQFTTLPDMYFLPASTGNIFNKAKYNVFSHWVDLLPVTSYCKHFKLEDINKTKEIEPDYGLSINIDRAFLLNKKLLKNVEIIEGGDCLCFYTTKFCFPNISQELVKKALDYLEQRAFIPKGYIFFEGTNLNIENQEYSDLVYIPFFKKC